MSAPVPLSSGCCSPPCPTSPTSAVPGPAGESAFSFTTANFTQPAANANVTITVTHDGWIAVGQTLFVLGGGFYTVISISGLSVVIQNNGSTGNSIAGTVIGSGAKVTPGGVGGTTGNAFTTTAANYTQPAIAAQVNVNVVASNWAAVGQRVFIATGGYYTVFSIPDATHINVTNDGDPVNAAPTTVINSPQQVSPAGLRGPTGATGVSTLNGVSPTTTKGDILADNGANSPSASIVRLAVGTNGKALVADSTQATGLNYATIQPNTVATSGDIAIYNGTSGTPTPLQDSKMLITADGALQSTPSGGNARGSKAVDLQVDRAANTQVASGADSVISGGKNNTASTPNSTVGGGTTNSVSGNNGTIGGGNTNVVSATNATVGGGNANQATAGSATVAGGDSNIASNSDAVIAGGFNNAASGGLSSILGGSTNTASASWASVLGGVGGKAYLAGQVAHATGGFVAGGSGQASELLWNITTTDATANVESFIDGIGARAVIPINTTWGFIIHTIARSSAGVCAFWETKGAIQNNANVVSLVAAVSQSVIADGTGATWGVTANHVISADNVNKSLKVAVTGAVATSILWNTHARLIEVGF